MMGMEAPCKDCREREIGCHGTCGRYQAFAERKRAQNEARARQRNIDDALKRREAMRKRRA